MQNLKYYVLWTSNSPLLNEYLDKFFIKLSEDLKTIDSKYNINFNVIELLNKKDIRDFLLNPDISSLINAILPSWDITSIEKLERDVNYFLEWWINNEKLIINSWKTISWTKIRLTLNENNPFSRFDAHPDHKTTWGNIWWWEKKEEEWLKVYEQSFKILKDIDSWIYNELNQIIKKIIPLWTAYWIHNSASFKECVGHLYLWYTVDSDNPEINNLEAIIHESSHNKLNLIMQFDPIVLNDKKEKYYSAIRPDARHIHWVFLWYHAFAPTMYIIMKAYKNWYFGDNKYWLEKIVLYHIKTKFLQKVIKKYAKLTPLWEEISQEIDYVITLMDNIITEIKPSKEILQNAIMAQKEHFNEVNRNYTYLEY